MVGGAAARLCLLGPYAAGAVGVGGAGADGASELEAAARGP